MDYYQTIDILNKSEDIETARNNVHLNERDNALSHVGNLLRHYPKNVQDAYAALMDAVNLGEEK